MRISEGRENELLLDDFAGFGTNGWTKLDFLACVSSLALVRLENQRPPTIGMGSKPIAVSDHIDDEESGRSKSYRDFLAPTKVAFKKPRSKARSTRPISAINLGLGLEWGRPVVPEGGWPTNAIDLKLGPEEGRPVGPEGGGPNAIDLRLGPEGGVPSNLNDKIEGMGGTRILLVCQRELTASDVNGGLSRLLMPESTIRSSFLQEDELQFLKTRAGPSVNEIRVVLVEPTLETCLLSLRRWEMKRAEYLLAGGWKEFVKRNGLNKGDLVQVWSFRVGPELRLAVVAARN